MLSNSCLTLLHVQVHGAPAASALLGFDVLQLHSVLQQLDASRNPDSNQSVSDDGEQKSSKKRDRSVDGDRTIDLHGEELLARGAEIAQRKKKARDIKRAYRARQRETMTAEELQEHKDLQADQRRVARAAKDASLTAEELAGIRSKIAGYEKARWEDKQRELATSPSLTNSCECLSHLQRFVSD